MFLNNDPMRYITGAVLLSLSSGVLAGTKGKEEPAKRPNILFVINDDQSYAHTSFAEVADFTAFLLISQNVG